MTTLLIGFLGLVLAPALVLAFILGRVRKTPSDICLSEDRLEFTLSSKK